MGSHGNHQRRLASRIRQELKRQCGVRTSASIRNELYRMYEATLEAQAQKAKP